MHLANTKKIINVLALAAVLAATSAFGLAQRTASQNRRSAGRTEPRQGQVARSSGQPSMQGGIAGLARRLNLNSTQRVELERIIADYLAQTRTLREQQRELRQKEYDPARDGEFDETSARAAAEALAKVQIELDVARARMLSRLYAILTPEQKTQLTAERQQREQRRREERERRRTAAPQTRQ